MTTDAAAAGICPKMSKSMSEWSFNQPNLLAESFPIDPIKENHIRRVPKCLFSRVNPEPLKKGLQLVSASDDVLTGILDLDPKVKEDPLFAKFIAGNELLPGSQPMAHRYGGFQFGYWADQLGDGRAILLGEYINSQGERWELQLKGAGKTPYSRSGDGRAVLRSSIREFLCSEAMEALGIPTSRAAAIVVSSDTVVRDQFYSGRLKMERAAVVLRLAKSWFRIGSLEILQRENELDNLRKVVDFTLRHCYPQHLTAPTSSKGYVALFRTIVEESATLVAKWTSVGFAHGVLNTDNMSLLSITIDYGPFGFLDSYDPSFIPNHSDDEGRYSFGNQSRIFKWNLSCLARALSPLVDEGDRPELAEILAGFDSAYQDRLVELFRLKLGSEGPLDGEQETQWARLIQLLLDMMELNRADFTQTFRQLSRIDLKTSAVPDDDELWAVKSISGHPNFPAFLALYRDLTLSINEEDRRSLMDRTNPQYVLRNWMAESAIRQAEADDFGPTNALLRILRRPYEVDQEAESSGYSRPPPSWSCSLRVSCSS